MAFIFTPATAHSFSTRRAPARSSVRPAVRGRVAARHAVRQTPRCADGPEGAREETVPLKDLKARLSKSQEPQAPVTENGQEGEGEEEEEDLRSDAQKEIDRLRAAEKFIQVDEGKFECAACGYVYEPAKGEPRNGIFANTAFEDLPDSYVCPSCRTPKRKFFSQKKVIAGFADNQTYGFGTNTMTGGEKSLLIFGGLVLCALFLLSGYALN